jgi:dephospho-CoA kinase
MMMLTIGLTGGIGSGKSTVSKMLAELGAPILDADKVAHTTYAPGGSAYQEVVAAFGDKILAADGTVDRAKLGPVVFTDSSQLQRLTSIVWPRTIERIQALIAEMRAKGETKPIVVEAAILIEANWQPMCDEVWLVRASKGRVIERIERDRGMKPEQTEARIRAQLSDEERRKHADYVIENEGSLEDLRGAVKRAWNNALARNR